MGAVEALKCDELVRGREKANPEIECFASHQHMHEDGDAASSEEVRGVGEGGGHREGGFRVRWVGERERERASERERERARERESEN